MNIVNKSLQAFRLDIAILAVIGVVQLTGQAYAQAVGFRVEGRNLVDATGNIFIIRGIAHPHVWYPSQTSSFANIKGAGANAIRLVLSGGRWTPMNDVADVARVVNLCKTNRLICVLENHDTTGFGEQSGAVSLAQAVSYWQSVQGALIGDEAYVIINIGNEPYGNNNPSAWAADTRNAIIAMRAAGFRHTLVVDAPNWGQDWQFVMRDNAANVFNADPDRNTVFGIHMYGVFDTEAEVKGYVSSFANAGLPLLIGEFGWNHSDGNPDEDAIMATAQANGIGYLAWSWSGNGGGVEYLDMVTNFNPGQRTDWGNRVIGGANGLRQTSREACVYGGCGRAGSWPRLERSRMSGILFDCGHGASIARACQGRPKTGSGVSGVSENRGLLMTSDVAAARPLSPGSGEGQHIP